MDGTISIAKLQELAKTLGEIAEKQVGDFVHSIGKSGDSLVSFSNIAKGTSEEIAKSLHSAAQAAHDLFVSFASSEFGNKLTDATKGFGSEISNIFKDSNLGVSNAITGVLDFCGVIDKSITGMGELGKTGYEAGAKLTTAFSSISPILKKATEHEPGFYNIANAAVEGTTRVIGLERQIISMYMAQGRAADITDQANGSFKDMNKSYLDYVNMSIMAARETGQTAASMMELSKALSSIPGSLDSAEETVKVSRIAVAAQMDQLAVAKQLADMYTRLGTEEQNAYEALAYMHEKAGDSKLRMEGFNQTVMTIAGSFKMLGDNTVATTNFVNAFDKAFEGSKISPEAMKEVLVSFGQGIERMDVAKKAFISGATGGPGGLAGAFQMDYAIQTGHVDEVIKKTMVAMQSQFGGQVVTLKDAAENPSLAGELYKQVQYLTQVAGVAKDDKEAYRILEAMKSGVMDILKPGAGADEKGLALERQLSKGNNLQSQTRTEIMKAHQTLEALRLLQDGKYRELYPKIDTVLGKITGKITGNETDRESAGAKHAGMREMAHEKPGEVGYSQYIEPNLDEMLGFSASKLNDVGKSAISSFGSLLSSAPVKSDISNPPKTTNPAETIKYKEIAESHMIQRPPPGTETGISNIAPGHKPDLGLPPLPKITLPTAKEEDVSMREGLPPLKITHEFEPIKIDISGIGDQIISRTVDAKLRSSQVQDIGQRALGR